MRRYTTHEGNIIMRAFAVVAAVVALLLGPLPALAQRACLAGAFPQADMAGIYIDPASPMRVEIDACGGSMVTWDNVYGRHTALYFSFDRLVGSGVLAQGIKPDPTIGTYLDDSARIAFKAAEPGYIQVGTFGLYDDTVRVYRLRKLG